MLLAATTYHFTEHLMHKTQRDRGFGSKLERVKGGGAIEMIQSREIISFRRVLFANERLYSRFPLISLNPFSFVAFPQSPLLFGLDGIRMGWIGQKKKKQDAYSMSFCRFLCVYINRY